MPATVDAFVLGAGPGGYAAAFALADLGLSVVLADERKDPGGVCLHEGCIPSKTLLHVATLLQEAEDAAAFGVRFPQPAIDLARLRRHKDEVVARLTGGLGQLVRRRRIRYLQGRGRFLGRSSAEVRLQDGGVETVAFQQAIIAAGSLPRTLAPLEGAGDRVWDSTAALALREIPQRLLVVGGGYIGVELASVYRALGSEVTIVEVTAGLLPGVDPDLVRPLAERLGRRVRILPRTRVARLDAGPDGLVAQLLAADGQSGQLVCDRVLSSVGRAPRTQGLGLEALGLQPDEHGFIPVDAARRTAVPGIYAIGDVAGQPMLAHKAAHEGRVAAEAIAGRKAAFDPAAIPAVVFTDPEIAWCGLSEADAQRDGLPVQVSRFPWAASGRAVTLGRPDGLTKLVADQETGRILGVGLVGPGAGELIAEGVLAVEMAALAEDVARSIHPHPTLSETLMEAAEGLIGRPTHYLGR